MTASEGLNRRRIVLSLLGLPVFCALFMFWPAGGFGWVKGWLFLAVLLTLELVLVVYVWRRNPEVIVARSQSHRGTKRWDKVLLACLVPAMVAVFPLAALDDGRFHWSNMPRWAVVTGYLLLVVGMVMSAAVLAVNPFAETTVRIQTDRGHRVVDRGPYAVVRHPMYLAAFFLFGGAALALGSWWALIPVLCSLIILVVRTVLEDRTLRRELPGYEAYAQRVRYRLMPGIW